MKFGSKDFFILFLVFIIGFLGGSLSSQNAETELVEGVDFTPFFEAWEQIENKFYFKEEEKQKSEEIKEKMLYGAIQGLVDGLGDSYSDFLTPDETLEFQENLTGAYEGIGAEIGIRDDILTVISPIKDTPAEAAGLQPGDKILKVDDESTQEMTLIQAVMKIRGEGGTEVNLEIKRKKEVLNIKIKRAKINIPTLDFEMLEGDIAYIQLYNFYEDAPLKFKETSQNILNSNGNKIILDLRSNPGGYLSAATDIGNFFIEKGKVIVKEDLGDKIIKETASHGPGAFSNFKIVVLINEGSASASEILAGAIKENNTENTTIIGKKSFGKGTVQEFVSLSDDSSLKLTVARWLLPSGKSIEEEGISPDIEVEITEKDIKEGKDPQLDKAIEVINR